MGKYLDDTGLQHFMSLIKTYVQNAIASIASIPAGGTTGQVLAKASNTDNDVMWASPASIQEVDPTVPSWAKQSSKPTYTASEVGAAPTSHASSSDTYGKGTSGNYGHVKLSDSTSSTTAAASGGTAATPKAVKDALDAAKTYADGIDVGVTGVKGNSESSYRSGNVNLTAANIGAAASSHTHSYLPLSGGTLTGHVYHDAKYIYCDAGNIDITTPPSSGTTGNSRVALRDKNGTIMAQFIPYIGSNGRYGTQLGTSGNWLYLTTDGTDPYVAVTNAAAWRTGLGLGASATHADSYFLKRTPASGDLPSTTNTGAYPIVLSDSFANGGVISYMTQANFRTAMDLQRQSDYYAASSATNVTVANTSLYRFLVILFRTNSATYTGNGTSAATSPLNSTVVHVANKTSGSIYASLIGGHRLTNTSLQFRMGLATITCSTTAGKVALSYQQYANFGNGASGTQEVGSQTDMALVGVIGIY